MKHPGLFPCVFWGEDRNKPQQGLSIIRLQVVAGRCIAKKQ